MQSVGKGDLEKQCFLITLRVAYVVKAAARPPHSKKSHRAEISPNWGASNPYTSKCQPAS
jgi:hypothetical protein